ncbi:hypothetical protein Bca52824_096872 [Brassica carinata]|uniref:Exocyst subunit Exo70 family protein n=1 Tax=Brassica carinata TaxID=52824 RepID=A0A8X7TI24_BRACI|nr:hypothetical protein Bca52824_096872 [Brassica carinata]
MKCFYFSKDKSQDEAAKNRKFDSLQGSGSEFNSSTSTTTSITSSLHVLSETHSNNLKVFALEDLKTATKSFSRSLMIGEGGFGGHEGLMHNGKIVKPNLKERFKSFNATFDEIHKTQTTWVVNDEQLQSELRVSITAVMIPAYRAFMARFGQYLDPGRQTEKYVKYQPEDIEDLIDELFEGNTSSSSAATAKRRT